MKIAIDISQIAYRGTGVASYTREMVKSLLRNDSHNDYLLFGISLRQLNLLNEFYEEVRAINDRVKNCFFPIPQTVGNFLWNKFHRLTLEKLLGKIDIYHSSDWIQPPTQAKKVTTIHDLVIYKYPDVSNPQIIKTQKRRLEWVKRECHAILADSQTTKKDIVNILHIKPEKIEVVYPGISQEFTRQNNEEIIRLKQKYGLLNEYILSVGTIEPRKNIKRVIRAFESFLSHPLIAALKKPIELIIAGNCGWDNNLPPGNNYIKTLGYVTQSDLPALYSGASLFTYPSLYEGFGLPVLEAMACGVPVISSSRGSLKEVASDSAILVDPESEEDIASKMVQIFIDATLRSELITKGAKHAAFFTWDKAAREILSVYGKLSQ